MLEKRVQHLDGLRGLCCLWVMWYHLGVMLNLNSQIKLGVFYQGMVPVYLFFILSGFVIAALIREKQESYLAFIFRRFFRIWPVFALLSVIGIFCLNYMLDVLPLLGESRKAIEQHVEVYQASQQYWWQHLLIHFSMLHGFFDEVIPWSSKAFIPPGWTITVEWQFYLVAPLLVASFRYGLVLLVWLVIYWAQLKYTTHWNGVYLFEYANYFLMGIASYLAVMAFQTKRPYLVSVLGMAAAIYFYMLDFRFAGYVALFFWAVFVALVYSPFDNFSRIVSAVFDNKVLVFYGEISYSLYLVHMFIVFAVLTLTLPYRGQMPPLWFFGVNTVLLTVIASLIAAGLYRWVELPCMRWAAKKVRVWKF